LPRLSAISFGGRVVLSTPIVANPARGMMRLWTLDAHAHGAEVVSYFRWRQAPFAQEQMRTADRRLWRGHTRFQRLAKLTHQPRFA
jgi:beta-galactosidase GanA